LPYNYENNLAIHILENGNLVEYKKTLVEKEIDLEEFIETHPKILDNDFFIIGRQVATATNTRIDLMGLDKEGNVIIIEIKKGQSPREAVSQILEYAVWAEGLQYEDLNEIAKEKHLSNYPDLYKKYEQEFKTIPEPFNENQRLYIVAEKIDEKIEDMSRYLRIRNLDIKCVELNFFEKGGQRLVNTNVIVGTEETIYQDLTDEVQSSQITWDDKLNAATKENRERVLGFISKVEEKFNVKGKSNNRWFFIYIGEPYERKNLFCVIRCGKQNLDVCFRIDPESFNVKNDDIRMIKGYFYSKSTERRIRLTNENAETIMGLLEHSYNATVSYSEGEKQRRIDAANKAVATRTKQDPEWRKN